MAFYTAKNLSARPVKGTATFNVTPGPGRQIFQQDPVLLLQRADCSKPGEEVRMPVVFFVDPEILEDPDAPARSAKSP